MGKTNFAMVLAITSILVFQTNSMETIEEKVQEKGNTNLRKLGFNFDIEKTFPIKTFSVYGQKIVLKYRVAVKDGKASNQIIIDSNLGSFKFGNDGVNKSIIDGWHGKTQILTFRFPRKPEIVIGIIASGHFVYSVKHTDESKTSLNIFLEGELNASAKIVSQPNSHVEISASAEGTIARAVVSATVTKNDITTTKFKCTGTEIKTLVEARKKFTRYWTERLLLFENWTI